MALSYIRFLEADNNRYLFKVDIGTNRFYSYTIGDKEVLSNKGLKRIQNPHFTSQLIGALPKSNLGRTVLEIPGDRFDNKNRYIQVTSFRTEKRIGPAISEIISIIPISNNQNNQNKLSLPAISFSMENQSLETVPFSYREAKPISSAMFIGALKTLIPKVLPAVKQALPAVAGALPTALPMLGNLVGAIAGNNNTNEDGSESQPGGIAQIIQAASNPETAQLIASLLQQVESKIPAPNVLPTVTAQPVGAMVGTAKPTPIPANSQLRRKPKPALVRQPRQNTRQNTKRRMSRGKDISTSMFVESRLSQEMAASAALLSALPALMPLLEKVLTPETINSLMENMPANKLMGAVTDGLKQVGGMIQESEKRTLDHLEKMMPTHTDSREVNDLFLNLSLGLAKTTSNLNYQRVEAVKLEFSDVASHYLQGRSRILYRSDRDLSFPLQVETPRGIKKGFIQLLVKNPVTLEVLIERRFPVENVTSGSLEIVPKITAEQLKILTKNEDYLVCATLVWQGKSKQTKAKIKLGSNMTQLITLIDEYYFDSIQDTAEIVPLNNVDKFRSYWHKIWQGSFSKSLRRITFDCKYYYTLEPERKNHARMETLVKIDETKGKREQGKLKTGLICSPYILNQLLGNISDYSPLQETQLTALLSSEFKQNFHYAARTQVEFKGDVGDTVALWIYPEMKIQQIKLKKAETVNENGHILDLSEQIVHFPMPGMVHFIGTSTDS